LRARGALPTGRALDIGCGTGTQAVYMAGQGWEVTGMDAIDRPLRKARARAAAAGASVDWVRGDVTRLGGGVSHRGQRPGSGWPAPGCPPALVSAGPAAIECRVRGANGPV
jgi:SAM-dependent methyltransferase